MKLNFDFPDNFTIDDRAALLAQIEHGRSFIRPHDGPWETDWLLSSICARIWLLRTYKTRLVNGTWVGVAKFDWDIRLCDGTSLIDDCNRTMLITAQKAAFLVRYLHSFDIDSTIDQLHWLSRFSVIIRWLYLHRDLYKPQIYCFSLSDTDGIVDFMIKLVRGGKASVLQYPEMCLSVLYERALGVTPPDRMLADPYNIKDSDRKTIVAWLKRNKFYKRNTRRRDDKLYYIDRQKLCKLLDLRWKEMICQKVNAFLRQFEPVWAHLS